MSAKPPRAPFGSLIGLAWPVLVSQLSNFSLALIDTAVVGHRGTDDLAAVTLGASIFMAVFLSLLGCMQSLLPLVAHAAGARQYEEVGVWARQGLWLAVGLGLLGGLLIAVSGWLLRWTDAAPVVLEKASSYMHIVLLALPAMLLQRALQLTANGTGHPRPLMLVALLNPPLHLLLAWSLVNGHIPGMPTWTEGAPGAALSEVIVQWSSLLLSVWLVRRLPVFRPYRLFERVDPPQLKRQRELLAIGLPIGAAYLMEVSAFTLVALLVARLGSASVGAHRIALNLASLLYMVYMALATAVGGMVGRHLGAREEAQARRVIATGLSLGLLLALGLGAFLWLARGPLLGAFSQDPVVLQLCGVLLIYVCAFQLFDATQTVATYALRAYKVTAAPLLIYVVSFGGLGLGLGSWLCFGPWQQGVAGYWQGLLVATIAAAALLLLMLHQVVQTRRMESAFMPPGFPSTDRGADPAL